MTITDYDKLDRLCSLARIRSKRDGIVWVVQTGPDAFQIETSAVPHGMVIAQYEFGKSGTRLDYEP